MRNLKIMLVVALGAVLFSSCSRGYGCFYGSLESQEVKPEMNQEVISVELTSQDTYTSKITR